MAAKNGRNREEVKEYMARRNETAAKCSEKQRGKPFRPGESGNPNGRRKGVPNRINLTARLRVEHEADPIGRIIDAAVTGQVNIGGKKSTLTAEQYLALLRELRRIVVPDAKRTDHVGPARRGDSIGRACCDQCSDRCGGART